MEKRASNNSVLKKISVLFIAIIGFITTIKLAIIYFDSNFNPYALPSFCSVSEFVDCDGVAQTTHSQFFGIPLAYWGMFLYLFIAFLLFVDKLKNIKFLHFLKVFKHPMAYISALGFISFAISMILAGISVFEIKKICVLCVFTYFLNLLIAIIATNWYTRNDEKLTLKQAFWAIFKSFKISVKDFFHAIRVKKYLISFLFVGAIGASVLTYTTMSYCFTPQVKRIKSIKQFADLKTNPFKSSGNVLGEESAQLKVHIYTDYRCPICYSSNLMNYRAAQELGGVEFIHHDLPLDIECNKHLRQPFHEGSCMLARYSAAAETQGHLWDMNSELFEKQPKTENEVLDIAKKMNLDIEKLQSDANSEKTANKIQSDIETAVKMGIEGTPAIVINGKVTSGILPYYELKDTLIKAGANEKK